MMNIELICSGTELLTGKLNTNASFIGELLSNLGLDLSLITTVADRKNEFCKVFSLAKERSSVIIVTGGLGPTFDDITVETASEILGIKTYKDEKVSADISQLFEKRGITNPPLNNERHHIFWKAQKSLKTDLVTAPGQMLHFEYTSPENKKIRKTIFLLPGPPRELRPMFEEEVMPISRVINRE
jgi:nicotinamide-nucleotide amidase